MNEALQEFEYSVDQHDKTQSPKVRAADTEIGMRMHEEAVLDAQIEGCLEIIRQREAAGEDTSEDLKSLSEFQEKKKQALAAREEAVKYYGYKLSPSVADYKNEVSINGVSKKEYLMSQEQQLDQLPTETGISYKQSPEDKTMKAADPVVYKDLQGEVIPLRPSKQEPVVATEETPISTNELGKSLLYDETIVRINKEISEIKQKAREATVQLRDHTKDAAEPQKTIQWVDTRMSELNRERTEHIKNKIKNASIEEVRAIKDAAHEVIVNQSEMYKTEAVEAIQEIDKRVEQEKMGDGVTTPTTSAHSETMEVEKIAPDPYVVEYTQEIKTNETIEHTQTENNTEKKPVEPELSKEVEKEPNPFEKTIAGIRSEDPARAERLLATIGANPEQRERIEKLLGATQIQKEKIETEAKEKGVLDMLRGVGERYQKIPLKWKLGIGAALIGGAFATGGAGILGSVFTLGITARRGMVGLGTFVTVESLGRKWVDSSNVWENEKDMGRKFATLGGVIAGVLAAGGAKIILDYYEALHGEAVPPVKLPDELVPSQETTDAKALREYATAVSPEEKADIAKVIGRTTAEMDAQIADHAPAAETTNSIATPQDEYAQRVEAVREVLKSEGAQTVPVETTYAVHGGDNLWNIIKEKIPQIQNLDGEGRQSNAIANVIEQIKKDPESFGISSGDVDSLSAGDTLDLEKVHEILKTAKIPIENGETAGIIERASGLTDVEASHIIDNNAKIAEWHTAHPDAPLTTEVADKILNTPTGAETIENETHADQYENIRKDMETTEAISMKADAAIRDDIQTMFGSKGFFGYGFLGTNGEKSVDWLDFKGRPVSEIMSKKFDVLPVGEEGAVQKFGIDSSSAVDKLKGYIKLLVEKSGVNPDEGESVEHFTKRGINIVFSKK
ncbi:MAG: hypothetical protein HZB09_00495 [Candidatus Yonathbacteria bacterium]|nr:hypothetical protein [Candidatus Yonathbacteria bacterium]